MASDGKNCKVCHTFKPYSEYYVHKQMADGYLEKCKECHKQRIRSNRLKNAEYYLAYDRKRADQPNRVQARKDYAKTHKRKKETVDKWISLNREKRHAHSLVGSAIKCGRLTKQPCEICGELNVDAHHDDYSKPLEVRWLCRAHHMELHRNQRNLPMDIPKPKSKRWT